MKIYKKDSTYSYALGAFPVFELLKNRPEAAIEVLYHEKFKANAHLERMRQLSCKAGIEIREDPKMCQRLSPKDNTLVIGVFKKYDTPLKKGKHLVLYQPSDMGNIGTIMRTALGFDFLDIALIAEHADYFHPKTVRASMGSIFSLRVLSYPTFDAYRHEHMYDCYPLMLNATTDISDIPTLDEPFSLIFGNEGSGLPSSFLDIGTPVVIPHSKRIDSLNLPIAAALAMSHFYCSR